MVEHSMEINTEAIAICLTKIQKYGALVIVEHDSSEASYIHYIYGKNNHDWYYDDEGDPEVPDTLTVTDDIQEMKLVDALTTNVEYTEYTTLTVNESGRRFLLASPKYQEWVVRTYHLEEVKQFRDKAKDTYEMWCAAVGEVEDRLLKAHKDLFGEEAHEQ